MKGATRTRDIVTWLDRVLLGIAPGWAARRIRTRMAVDLALRNYEAARPGRRTSGWARTFADADLTIQGALVEARIHARDLCRNNSWAKRAKKVITNNTIGWGLVPAPKTEDEKLKAAVNKIWSDWADTTECDAGGQLNMYGLQSLAMKTIVESGEVIIRRRWRKRSDGLSVPMQIQVLEPDFLDHTKTLQMGQSGGPIIQGIEYDAIGRRAAYWLFSAHPGSGRNTQPSKRIPASEIRHVYDIERAGQSRGISWFVVAILNLKDFDEFEDAELVRQKVAACFAAFVTDLESDGPPPPLLKGGPAQPSGEPPIDQLEPGTVVSLPPGRDVKFGVPPAVTDTGFATRTLRRIAAGMGVTYEDMTGDYSQVNFSSARMGRIAHYENVRDWRWNMFIPGFCAGVWGWLMEAAVMDGKIREALRADWTPSPTPMLDPVQESRAYQGLVRTGAMTPDEMVRERGGDPDTHWTEYAANFKRLDELGITIDADARKVTASGQAQSTGTALKQDGEGGNP